MCCLARKVLYIFPLVMAGFYCSAQSIERVVVKGKVMLEDNSVAVGATLLIKGKKRGTAADTDGNFTINVLPADTLVCSLIGYEKQVVPVGNQTQFAIRLVPSTTVLQAIEIVSIGYGKMDRAKLTGSVASLKAKDLDSRSLSFDNALNGKLAGVLVNTTSGQPGSATAITIRGISTFQQDGNNPLFVIDGIPVYGSNSSLNSNNFEDRRFVPGFSFGGTSVSNTLNNPPEFERNPLANLNPDDIASIEVLKDAYATAIYGSRGAAGVILVNTKTGKKGKGKINVGYKVGINEAIGRPNLLTGKEYGKLYTEYQRQSTGGIIVKFDTLHNTNWLEEVIRPAVFHNLNVSLSGGGDKSRYYTSLSVSVDPSYIIKNDFKRYSARLNYDYKPQKIITIGTNFQLSYTDNSALNAPRIYGDAMLKAPNVPIRYTDGNYIWASDKWKDSTYNFYGNRDINPVAIANNNINYLRDFRTIGNLFLEISPTPWLTLRSEGGLDMLSSTAYSRERERPSLIGGSAVQTTQLNFRTVINNTLTINKDFGRHSINAVLGHSFEASEESRNRITGAEFFDDDLLSIGASEAPEVAESVFNEWALNSYFTRINYIYNARYIVGFTYRVDGSSRFAKNNRYVGFPSFSVGWIASEERFLKEVNWMNQLKIRASIGFSGINGSGQSYYGSQGVFALNSSQLTYGDLRSLELVQPVNPNLRWERTRTIDAGLDLTLVDGLINLTIDYYHKLTTDLLFPSALSPYKGFTTIQQNIGSMENTGIEFTLNINYKKGNFEWFTSLNLANNSNKIKTLNVDGEQVSGAGFNYKYFKEGEPAGQFYLYEWGGVDAESGNAIWIDKDGEITATPPASRSDAALHRKPFGPSVPTIFGGINNTVRYKNFSLTFFFNYSLGGQLFNGSRAALLTYTTSEANNLSKEILTAWEQQGDVTDVPQLKNSSVVRSGGSRVDYLSSRTNSRFLEDNSFLRLKTLKLAFEFPKKIISKLALSRLQCYVEGSNIWTWTAYSGIDPEVTIGGSSVLLNGFDELSMPQVRSWAIGLNISL